MQERFNRLGAFSTECGVLQTKIEKLISENPCREDKVIMTVLSSMLAECCSCQIDSKKALDQAKKCLDHFFKEKLSQI